MTVPVAFSVYTDPSAPLTITLSGGGPWFTDDALTTPAVFPAAIASATGVVSWWMDDSAHAPISIGIEVIGAQGSWGRYGCDSVPAHAELVGHPSRWRIVRERPGGPT